MADATHNTIAIDDVMWQAKAGIDNVSKTAFGFYLNPAKESITLATHAPEGTVALYSITGGKLLEKSFNAVNKTIDVTGLTTGLYITEVQAANTTASTKLIIE